MPKQEEFWICDGGGEICKGEPGSEEELDECEIVELLNDLHDANTQLERFVGFVSRNKGSHTAMARELMQRLGIEEKP